MNVKLVGIVDDVSCDLNVILTNIEMAKEEATGIGELRRLIAVEARVLRALEEVNELYHTTVGELSNDDYCTMRGY